MNFYNFSLNYLVFITVVVFSIVCCLNSSILYVRSLLRYFCVFLERVLISHIWNLWFFFFLNLIV